MKPAAEAGLTPFAEATSLHMRPVLTLRTHVIHKLLATACELR